MGAKIAIFLPLMVTTNSLFFRSPLDILAKSLRISVEVICFIGSEYHIWWIIQFSCGIEWG